MTLSHPVDPSGPLPPKRSRHQDRLIYLALIVLGGALTLFFGLRLLRTVPALRHLHPGPPVTDVSVLRGWMTVPHVARMVDMPEDDLWAALDIPGDGNHRASLKDLGDRYFGEEGAALEIVRNAVAAYQSTHAPPPGPDSPTRPDPANPPQAAP